MPEFTFEIKGVTLNMDEMHKVHKWYQIYNTAEYLLESYPQLSEERAVYLASAVRDLMDHKDYDEEDAVYEVLNGAGIVDADDEDEE
jgi:hypothetical protein